jgi:methionyl-tRNA synthetase
MLMAAEIEVPRSLFIHGFLLMDEHKMSKSIGNVIDPFEIIDRFGADTLRFYLFREVNFGSDGSLSAAGFETRYNSELANEYGNLASRTLSMIGRYRDGVVPPGEPDAELAAELDGLDRRVCDKLDAVDITGALEEIWHAVRRLNRFVQDEEPWKLAKDEGAAGRLDQVLYSLAEGLRSVSVLLHPYMPESAGRLLGALGQEELSMEAGAFGSRPGGATTEQLSPLFPRIEPAAA